MGKNKLMQKNQEKKTWLHSLFEWGLLGILLLTPLLYSGGRIAGTVTSKQFFFIGMVDLLVIAWAWLMMSDSRFRLGRKFFLFSIPVGLFFISLGISTVLSADVWLSVYSTVERGVGFIFMMHILLFMGMIASQIRVTGLEFIKKVAQAILAAAVVVAVVTFFTKEAFDIGSAWLNETAGGGLMGNSTIAGAYFVFASFMTVILLIIETVPWKKIMYSIGGGILLVSPIFFNIRDFFVTKTAWADVVHNPLVLIGQARAAVIGVVLGLVIAGLVYIILVSQKKIVKWVSGVVIAMIMVGIGWVGYSIFQEGSAVRNAFISSVGLNRIMFWEESFAGIAERPIVGWGPENFRMVHQNHFDPRLLSRKYGGELWVDKPHNVFIEILVTQGWIGFITYIGVIGSITGYCFWLARKGLLNPKIVALFIGTIVGYVFQNQFAFDSITSLMCFWLLFGIVLGLLDQNDSEVAHKSLSEYVQWIGWGITVMMIAAWVFFAVIPSRKMIEARTVFNATTVGRIPMYPKIFSGYGARYLYTDLGVLFYGLAESYSSQRQVIASDPRFVPVSLQELNMLIDVGIREQAIAGHDYRLMLSLAMFQETALSLEKSYPRGKVDTMLNYANKAVAFSPTNPLGYLVLGRALLYTDQVDAIRTALTTAVELNPEVEESHDQRIAFERAYGTQQQLRSALELARKYFPQYQLP